MSKKDTPIVGARCVVDEKIGIGWSAVYEDGIDKLIDDTRDIGAMNVLAIGEDAIMTELRSRYPDREDGTVGVLQAEVTDRHHGIGEKRLYWIRTNMPMLPEVNEEVLIEHLPRLKRIVTVSRENRGVPGSGEFYRYRYRHLGQNVCLCIYSYEPYAALKDRYARQMAAYRETAEAKEFKDHHLRDLLRHLGPTYWSGVGGIESVIQTMDIRDSSGWGRSVTRVTLAHIRKMFKLIDRVGVKLTVFRHTCLIATLRYMSPYFYSVEQKNKYAKYTEDVIDENHAYVMRRLRQLYRAAGLPQPRRAKPPKEPKELIRARQQKDRRRRATPAVRPGGQGLRPAVPGVAA